MTSIVAPARELHELHQEAERRYQRDQLPAATHDIYVRTYVEAVMVERHRRRELEANHAA